MSLSKHEEIELLRKLVAELPRDSYLAEMFNPGAVELIEAEIANDSICLPLPDVWAESRKAMAELQTLSARKLELASEIRTLERTRDKMQDGLADLRNTARKMAGV